MRRLILLLLAVAAVGGGYAVAATLGGSRTADRLPDAVGAVQRLRDGGGATRDRVRRQRARLRTARCPADLAGCRSVTGRVVYVESVDPDGDGDLHVVLLGSASITGPGVSAVDVSKDLRPARDPKVGDRVSAAGPVQTGSHGQSQVHAEVFRVAGG
jgi:hypothetical protein